MQSIVSYSAQFASKALDDCGGNELGNWIFLEPEVAAPQIATTTWDIPFRSERVVALIFAFIDKSLRQLCENEEEAIKKFGNRVAGRLKSRLADLHAADSASDIPVGNPREIEGAESHCMSVDLCDGHTIIFCANHVSIPKTQHGKVDWSKVNRIKFLEIEGDNG